MLAANNFTFEPMIWLAIGNDLPLKLAIAKLIGNCKQEIRCMYIRLKDRDAFKYLDESKVQNYFKDNPELRGTIVVEKRNKNEVTEQENAETEEVLQKRKKKNVTAQQKNEEQL